MSRHVLLPAILFLGALVLVPALSSDAYRPNSEEVGPVIIPCPISMELCTSVDKLYQQCVLGPAAHVMTNTTAMIKKQLKKIVEENDSLTQLLEGSRQEVKRLQFEMEELKNVSAAQSVVCKSPNFQVGLQCFFLSSDKQSWISAVSACRARGGTLAEPNNPRQLIAKIREMTQERVYLGGNDRAREGHWVGVSGRPFNIKGNWNRGEPNSHLGQREDCINIHAGRNGLNDVSCHHRFRYVCEM